LEQKYKIIIIITVYGNPTFPLYPNENFQLALPTASTPMMSSAGDEPSVYIYGGLKPIRLAEATAELTVDVRICECRA